MPCAAAEDWGQGLVNRISHEHTCTHPAETIKPMLKQPHAFSKTEPPQAQDTYQPKQARPCRR